jgi:hypothetical protein
MYEVIFLIVGLLLGFLIFKYSHHWDEHHHEDRAVKQIEPVPSRAVTFDVEVVETSAPSLPEVPEVPSPAAPAAPSPISAQSVELASEPAEPAPQRLQKSVSAQSYKKRSSSPIRSTSPQELQWEDGEVEVSTEGVSFGDIQNSLLEGTKAIRRMNVVEQEAPVRMAMGKTIEEFQDEHMVAIPESIASAWMSSSSAPIRASLSKSVSRSELEAGDRLVMTSAESSMMLRDAMSYVPNDKDNAAIVLQEMLVARRNAKTYGMTLPSLEGQQKRSVEAWAQDEDLGVLSHEILSL